MKRFLVVLGVILLVLAAAAGGAYWWLSRPVELETFNEPGPSMAAKQQNSLVQTMLLSDGIEASYVDITAERAYVAYDMPPQPADETLEPEDTQETVLFALASAAPESDRAVIVLFVDKVAALRWTADLDAFRALPADDEEGDALEAYLATVERTEL